MKERENKRNNRRLKIRLRKSTRKDIVLTIVAAHLID